MENQIFQFKITLEGILPSIWRRIQVPDTYSFWDLHIAIQDAMGWLDYHLHVFHFLKPHKMAGTEIGIPGDEMDGEIILPGWETRIRDYFTKPGDQAIYEYDFGDSWEHELVLEAILPKEAGVKYPRCIAGERACPPEDCGGVGGYEQLVEILSNSKHEAYHEMIAWLKGHAKNYHPFRPDAFNPEKVRFANPKTRWKKAFPDK